MNKLVKDDTINKGIMVLGKDIKEYPCCSIVDMEFIASEPKKLNLFQKIVKLAIS